jgi:hypothetical protein
MDNYRVINEFNQANPPTRKEVCAECPWSRDAVPGHLGPNDAETWCEVAHSDSPVACHMTLTHEGWLSPNVKQCAGVAIFRGNIGKSPRDPRIERWERNVDTVFAWDDEFIAYHEGEGT